MGMGSLGQQHSCCVVRKAQSCAFRIWRFHYALLLLCVQALIPFYRHPLSTHSWSKARDLILLKSEAHLVCWQVVRLLCSCPPCQAHPQREPQAEKPVVFQHEEPRATYLHAWPSAEVLKASVWLAAWPGLFQPGRAFCKAEVGQLIAQIQCVLLLFFGCCQDKALLSLAVKIIDW